MKRNCGCGVLVVVCLGIALALPVFVLCGTEMPIVAFHPERFYGNGDYDSDNFASIHQEIYETREMYEDAADRVNDPLVGMAKNYGIGWGILAAIDLMAADDEYWAYELAEMLESRAEYKEVVSTTSIWKMLPEEMPEDDSIVIPGSSFKPVHYQNRDCSHFKGGVGSGDYEDIDYDLSDFYPYSIESITETLVTAVDTYKGLFEFEYDKTIDEYARTGSDGSLEVVRVSAHYLMGISFEPSWERLKVSVMLRYGDHEVEPPDMDMIFAEEYGKNLQQGTIHWDPMDQVISMKEYSEIIAQHYWFGFPGYDSLPPLLISPEGYVWPVPGYPMSQGYHAGHRAIDIGTFGKVGVPVLAVTGGRISRFFETVGGGGQITLDGYDGRQYLYAHIAPAGIYCGKDVDAGEVIAYVAPTRPGENSTGPHLHFEVWINGANVNPIVYCGW